MKPVLNQYAELRKESSELRAMVIEFNEGFEKVKNEVN